MNRAYDDALKLLARRELSEAQIRQRLERRGHDTDPIDDAVARLRAEGAIDDRRVAETIARRETSGRGRGPLRVRQQIERAGIARGIARKAADEAAGSIGTQELMEAALQRRLRGRARIEDIRELQKLHRYLISQGFDPEQALQRINRLRRSS